MDKFKDVELRIRNFKSFGSEGGAFSAIRRTNIVIGRNNSGKSALMDLVERACTGGTVDAKHFHKGVQTEISLTVPMSEEALRIVFSPTTTGGPIPASNHWDMAGRHLIGTRLTMLLGPELKYLSGIGRTEGFWVRPEMKAYYDKAVQRQGNPFKGLIFRRVSAERDVQPEGTTTQPMIQSNGAGLTSTIAFFINRANQPSHLVEREMLAALNTIFAPDATYSNIIVQQLDTERWEVYLIEDSGERIALSDSGSGLKTILQVLACLILVPFFENKRPEQYVFAFEELENNLHPALQRRLLSFVVAWAKANGAILFVTTHSNVVIDMFATDEQATITHVSREAGVSKTRPVDTYVAGRELLEDLDVRASDLLQANGLVWLEGPSDRIYFNRWISLVTSEKLREGTHYQCVYYGGKLLAHLSGETPDVAPEELIATLRVNKNALILMDSDRRSSDARTSQGRINATKRRIQEEFAAVGAVAAITEGKEIENYIPHATLKAILGDQVPALGPFEYVGDFLESHRGVGERTRFESNKIGFARETCAELTLDAIDTVPALRSFIDEAVSSIKRWNSIQP